MKTFHNKCDFNIDTLDFLDFKLEDAVFFDIETTGFSASHTKLYLIGCVYYDKTSSSFHTIQWFLDNAEKYDAERDILSSFIEFIKSYKYLIHFNGDGFDIPYITHKCEKFNLETELHSVLSSMENIDLYKTASSLKNVLKLENLKQKTLESFLGISREDKFSGGELIKVYDDYLKNKDDASLALLILHNLDDIKGLLNLLEIFKYRTLFNGSFNIHSISVENTISSSGQNKREVIIELSMNYSLPARISGSNNIFYMTAFNNKTKIKIPVYTEELKYFYPNYKDYYYLPEEDCSIHKSVAFYVDKNFRTQAKAANCYSKKTGQFLPQLTEIISPYFKIEYNDKITYFEVTDEFLKDAPNIKIYSLHVLKMILSHTQKKPRNEI